MHASSLSSRTELRLWCNGSVLDRRFKPRSSQNKDNKFGICFLSTTHAALRSKSTYLIGSESTCPSGGKCLPAAHDFSKMTQ